MNKILFFAHLRDAVDKDAVMLDVTGKTIAELKEIVGEKFPSVELDQVMVAINEEFATDEEMIHEGDIIAFIPPVSGG